MVPRKAIISFFNLVLLIALLIFCLLYLKLPSTGPFQLTLATSFATRFAIGIEKTMLVNSTKASPSKPTTTTTRNSLKGDDLFVWNAFMDYRSQDSPRIRVNLLGNCERLKSRFIDEILIYVDDRAIPIHWIVPTTPCPSKCKYTSIDITTRKYQYFNDVKEITVKKWRRGYVNAKIGVRKMFGPEAQENGITSCLKPLLWFNDWRRLLLYFELARGIGYTRFLIAWNFVSSDVKKVIDHYRNLSLVDIPYPITANDPQLAFNPLIGNTMENLWAQSCSYLSQTKYTSYNDFDEIFYVKKNISLFDLLEYQSERDVTAGAFVFARFGFAFESKIREKSFSEAVNGLKKGQLFENPGIKRMIYANEFVREVSSTDVTKFFLNKKMRSMNSKDAIYLKINYEKDSGNDSLLPNIPLIEKDPELINRIRDRVKEIFGDKTPDYDRTILERYSLCSKDDKTCESPIGRCVSELENAEKWIQNDAPAWDKLYVL